MRRMRKSEIIQNLTRRVQELESKLCPFNKHQWISTGWKMHGGTGHGDETFDYQYECKRCGKKLNSLTPINTLNDIRNLVGEIVSMTVSDCFCGDVKLLKIRENVVFIEIIDVTPCYTCQSKPNPGTRYWINDYLIDSVSEKLPF